jgi:hypothetical protein
MMTTGQTKETDRHDISVSFSVVFVTCCVCVSFSSFFIVSGGDTRFRSFKTMHFCLATDIDLDGLVRERVRLSFFVFLFFRSYFTCLIV